MLYESTLETRIHSLQIYFTFTKDFLSYEILNLTTHQVL
jgi:hypothetical protein